MPKLAFSICENKLIHSVFIRGGGAWWSVVYRCVNKKKKKHDEKGYFFRAGQCVALSSFRVGKMLFL